MGDKTFFRTDADFNPDAVTRALAERYPGVAVSEAHIRAKHQGSASHVDLELAYSANPHALPARMFVKTLLDIERDLLPSGFADGLQGGLAIALYVTETRAYEEIADKIKLETPRIYAAGLGDRPGDFYLFMENLNDRSAVCPNVVNPLSVDRVSALVGELAKLHAAYWETPEFSSSLSWMDTATVGVGADFLRQGGWETVDTELSIPFKAAILHDIGVDLRQVREAFWARQALLEAGPDTLLHGDPHPGNIYFLQNGAVGLLDWQLARRGPWTHDISYAITAALDPEERRRSERDLLGQYRSDLTRLGVSQPPSFEEMWQAHRTSPAWGLPMWGITPAAMYSEAEIGTVMRRFGAAWKDFDTTGALGIQ